MIMQEEKVGLLEEEMNSDTENIGGVYLTEASYPRQQYLPVASNASGYQSGYESSGSSNWHQQSMHNEGKILLGPPTPIYQKPGSHSVISSSSRRIRPAATEEENRACRCSGRLALKLGLRSRRGLWCVDDTCGIVCAIFTWMLIAYAEFVVIFVILIPAPSGNFRWINGIIFHIFSGLAISSHLRAMFSNPGTVSLGNATKDNIIRMGFREGQIVYKCPKCTSIKPERTHHCSICRRCIQKMDHHCPWINNCVGLNNQKYFVLFTLYIAIMSFYSIYLSVHFFIMCLSSEWEVCRDSYSPPIATIYMLFLIVEGILFGIFTLIMFIQQLQAVWTDETGIENLKKEQPTWERRSRWLSMENVFGRPFSMQWFLPVSSVTTAEHDKLEINLYSV